MKKIIFVLSLLILTSLVMGADTTMGTSYTVLDSEVAPGGETTVVLTLTNPSTTVDIDTIKIYLSGGDYITAVPTQISVGGLEPTQSKDVSIIVEADDNAISKVSYMNARIVYYAPTSKSLNVNIPIQIRMNPTLQITDVVFERQPEPGSTVEMNLTLKNTGDGTSKDIQLELDQSENFIADKNEAFIPSLPSKTEKTVSFVLTFDPDMEIGIYQIPVNLMYKDADKSTSYDEDKSIGVKISGSYNFIITADTQQVLAPGKLGKVSIKISNAGTAAAQFLSASFGDSEMIYIGEIDSDDYEVQEFETLVPSDTELGRQTIDLIMNYKDDFGQEQELIYPVYVKISDEGAYNAYHNPIEIMSIITFVIFAFIVHWIYKKYFHVHAKKHLGPHVNKLHKGVRKRLGKKKGEALF
jgi:hypothetical protein